MKVNVDRMRRYRHLADVQRARREGKALFVPIPDRPWRNEPLPSEFSDGPDFEVVLNPCRACLDLTQMSKESAAEGTTRRERRRLRRAIKWGWSYHAGRTGHEPRLWSS